MRTYEYRGKQVTLERSSYQNNGTVALIMHSLNGEEYAVVTVNLNHPMQSDDIAFLDENNLPGIGKWIEEHHLGMPMGVIAASGYCRYPLYMLFINKI